MKALYTAIAALMIAQVASAQEHRGPWTLSECIDYALENNISIRQRNLQVMQQEVELNTSQNSRLPQVSASGSQNYSFGRGLTADNTYSNTNTSSTGLNLGVSVPVFQGMRIRNTIKQNELNLQATLQDLEKAKDDIRVQVAQAYVQILCNMEILDVALNQIQIDSMQVERLSAMFENGKASSVQVAQQKATLGQSRLSATQARNNLQISLLDLSQLLELHNPEGFTVVRPSNPIDGILLASPDAIYADAVQNKALIKAEEFRMDMQDWNIKNAKSSYLPTISASGGLGTNYYTMSGGFNTSFFDQMKNNFSQFLGLSLSIPIFNGFQTRNQVRVAEISKQNQALQLESVKKTLYKEIQQAYYNAVAAQDKYKASLDAEASAKESYELVTAKYENGKANITEFNESRDAYLDSEANLAQARYEYLFQAKLLDFYRGQDIQF